MGEIDRQLAGLINKQTAKARYLFCQIDQTISLDGNPFALCIEQTIEPFIIFDINKDKELANIQLFIGFGKKHSFK